MSADPIYTVWCDHPGCGHWCEATDGSCTTAAAARKRARTMGWRVGVPSGEFPPKGGRSRLDYCPAHTETEVVKR